MSRHNHREIIIMEITMEIPDDLAVRLQSRQDQLPQIIELGLRKLDATTPAVFEDVSEILETLAAFPSAAEIIALRPSDELQKRIDALIKKNRAEGLQPEEEREWAHYEYLEHIVRLAKANAALKLKTK